MLGYWTIGNRITHLLTYRCLCSALNHPKGQVIAKLEPQSETYPFFVRHLQLSIDARWMPGYNDFEGSREMRAASDV